MQQAKEKLAHGLSSHECSKLAMLKDMSNHPSAPKVTVFTKTPTMKDALNMTEVNELEETKHVRMQEYMTYRDKIKIVNYKNIKQNTTNLGRNEEIKRKYNIQKKYHQRLQS